MHFMHNGWVCTIHAVGNSMTAECHCPSFPHFLRAACRVSVMGRRLVRRLVRRLFAVVAVT